MSTLLRCAIYFIVISFPYQQLMAHCDNATATITVANDMGNGYYEWELEWCLGIDEGEIDETGALKLLIMGATFDTYQNDFTSPTNGNIFIAGDVVGNAFEESIIYSNPLGELYISQDDGAEAGSIVCNTVSFTTLGIPTHIQLWGMEGNDDVNAGCFVGRFGIVVPEPETALPISLIDFSGNSFDSHNEIYWMTEFESDVKNYVIQKSRNGIDSWSILDVLEPQGVGYEYKTKDERPNLNNYYRLKTVDWDGHISYSNIIHLTSKYSDFSIEQLYPNPVTNRLNINYRIPEQAELYVMDAYGNQVFNIQLEAENDFLRIDTWKLESGIYNIILVTSELHWTGKFVKISFK